MKLNESGYEHARKLVEDGHVVVDDRDEWSEHQPSSADENHFIDEHGIHEFAKWHLGVDDTKPVDTKGRYAFPYGDFDLVGCLRVLHHVRRPELVVSELARVARPGGRILLVDQLGDVDPIRSLELDRFERVRDPTHTRLLPDADIRGYLDANDLTVVANEVVREHREMEQYLDLVGLEGEARERVARMAPESYDVELGWYVAVKHG